ncbi:flavoprotein [Streptacidiphilus sp. N1-3]|uniref:Flavoprotein n=1 Tax=Streptacidiphilus alkalitolerans TaxID=3342712 RepID=A0ABV6WYI9_9ACTN
MTGDRDARVLYVVVCAAGPAPGVRTLIAAARADGWRVYVIATPGAVAFLDVAAIEAGGVPVFSEYRRPDQEKRQPPADAAVVAPATYNTINKWAAGIADNYALGTLAELTGQRVPLVVLTSVNDALAGTRVFARSVAELRAEGVRILHPAEADPASPGFPWHLALAALR